MQRRPRRHEANLADLDLYVKALDPARPIMFDGDDDPGGVAYVINLHYPHEFPTYADYPGQSPEGR